MLNVEWRSRYESAVAAAKQAGQLALRYFTGAFAVEWKQDQSPVTVADREAEQLLRKALLGAFPDDGILGEEFGDQPGTSGFRWIVDPVDGTRSFVRGVPIWGTLVGLEYQARPSPAWWSRPRWATPGGPCAATGRIAASAASACRMSAS